MDEIQTMNDLRNKIVPNIMKLRRFLQKHEYTEEMLKEINSTVDNLTEEEIMLEPTYQPHPFLHELCEQWGTSFEFLQEMWKREIFKKFWENPDYRDKYGCQVLKRLSKCIKNSWIYGQEEYSTRIKWIEDNMHVIPEKPYVEVF
jgi:hypothetical protein